MYVYIYTYLHTIYIYKLTVFPQHSEWNETWPSRSEAQIFHIADPQISRRVRWRFAGGETVKSTDRAEQNPQKLQCEAPKIAKLVNITPITMVYGTYNEPVTGAFVNQLTSLGGPHIVGDFLWYHNDDQW